MNILTYRICHVDLDEHHASMLGVYQKYHSYNNTKVLLLFCYYFVLLAQFLYFSLGDFSPNFMGHPGGNGNVQQNQT